MGTVTGDRAAVTPDGSGRSVELAIGGMTCASCAARVEKKLNKLDGVTATVNFATETARVSYPGTASPDELIAAVEQAGSECARDSACAIVPHPERKLKRNTRQNTSGRTCGYAG